MIAYMIINEQCGTISKRLYKDPQEAAQRVLELNNKARNCFKEEEDELKVFYKILPLEIME